MDLVEAFGARSAAGGYGLDFMERVESGASGDLVIIEQPATSSSGTATDGPQLFVDTAIRQASRGRGAVTCVTASNDAVLVATSRGFLLRYGWDENGNERVSEVEVLSARAHPDHRITSLFTDPMANHVLAAVRAGGGGSGGGGAAEVYYLHRRWPRARALAELRGSGALTAVGWAPQQQADSAAAPPPPAKAGGGRAASSAGGSVAGSESCTGPILLGTEAGAMLETVLDERQKKEAPARSLIEGAPVAAPAGRERRGASAPAASPAAAAAAFTSLFQVALPGGRRALLASSPSHLRIWVAPHQPSTAATAAAAGGGGATVGGAWHAFFHPGAGGGSGRGGSGAAAAAASPPPPLAVLEAVAPSPYSQLQLWWPEGPTELPSRFGWLVGGVVYHGELDWVAAAAAAEAMEAAAAAGGGGAVAAAAAAAAGGAEVLSGVVSLPLEGAEAEAEDAARSLVVTEYHLLLLYGDRLRAVNRVNGRTVAARAFRSPLTRSVTGEPSREIDGLVRDPVSGTTYMAVDEALYEVGLQGESAGMWRVYLELQDWEAALRCCCGQAQRDEVHRARAEAALAAGDFRTAAVQYGKISDGRPPFEDIALRLSDCGDPAALPSFLSTRLAAIATPAQHANPQAAALTAAADGAVDGGAAAAATVSASAAALMGGGGGAMTSSGPLGGELKAQACLLSSWLTELRLDEINRALLEPGGEAGEAYGRAVAALRSHLSDWVHVLDPGTTISLLASYGRLDELLTLAALRGDHEGLLEQLLSRGQQGGAVRALTVLRSPAVSRELLYKFAPALVAAAAAEAVEAFVAERPPLDPRRLLPALLRYGEPDSDPNARRHVLRYVEYAIEVLGTTDMVVHNLAVALYSLAPGREGEEALLRYLTRAGRAGGAAGGGMYGMGGGGGGAGGTAVAAGPALYDAQYALRLAQECGRTRAAVRLMCQLGMYPDAVRAALALDLGLAKGVAAEAAQDDALRRKLWLQVARHVVESGGDGSSPSDPSDPASPIRTAVEFLREADGLLRIEDILPFFPDFVTIDNFQAAICDSLERYGAAIAGLKADMEEATSIAEALRRDIAMLQHRSAAVSLAQPCSRCGRPISEAAPLTSLPQGGALPPFYVFPTGCAYHVACCAAEVTELVAPAQRKRIHSLMVRLSRVKPGAATAPPYGGAPAASVASLQAALAAEIAAEDPRNGEITVRLCELPLLMGEGDAAEAESWAI